MVFVTHRFPTTTLRLVVSTTT